jgi:hypothetical protein
MKLAIVFTIFATTVTAQSAAEDPCALTIFHFDREVDGDEDSINGYLKEVTSMTSIAATSLAKPLDETLDMLRSACALEPTAPFQNVVSSLIDAGHVNELDTLRADFDVEMNAQTVEIRRLEEIVGAMENNGSAEERARSLGALLQKERDTVAVLRARISQLLAE